MSPNARPTAEINWQGAEKLPFFGFEGCFVAKVKGDFTAEGAVVFEESDIRAPSPHFRLIRRKVG